MKNPRIYYTLIFLSIIFLGILSRKISFIPLWIGDFLYAVMIYFLVRIFLPFKNAISIACLSLLICYGIEFLQLYQGEWMIELRKTLFGRYVLGQGFLWEDIIAYTFGILIAFIAEKFTLNFLNRKSV
ncbi:ribosomal maturation YjgA family protein [Flavobacterium notoginsengisoli]|uniref:ribosomal maturation YjgA family protein n=1 Tax=Flavobacterium notoginsengisoli TaxID=1478199 RepID=UPI00363B417B